MSQYRDLLDIAIIHNVGVWVNGLEPKTSDGIAILKNRARRNNPNFDQDMEDARKKDVEERKNNGKR